MRRRNHFQVHKVEINQSLYLLNFNLLVLWDLLEQIIGTSNFLLVLYMNKLILHI